ncbi:MAG: hypothetical protein LBV19_08670 [Streptococcaceae bacterium]|jgi:predicted enzyme related to lactoylglutathione lyase|nr:hypothetical protein [Streptococcaceae bacterium]
MTNLLEQIEEMRPVFRVSDRDATVNFYTTVLGLKLINENSFMLQFGSRDDEQICVICAISPESLGFHKAEGQKRHIVTIIKASQADIRQLIVRHKDKMAQIFYGASGYAFSTVSPDGDAFTVMTADAGPSTEIPKDDLDLREDYFIGLKDVSVVSTMIASPDAGDFYNKNLLVQYIHPVPVPTEAASDTETWDLGAVQFKLKEDVRLDELMLDLTDLNYSFNENTQLFSVTAPNNLELQFTK